MQTLDPDGALELARGSVDAAGAPPIVAVDLRRIGRDFRRAERDQELTRHLAEVHWISAGVVDDGLDPVFAPLADSFDVLIGAGTRSEAAVDVAESAVGETLDELASAVTVSPHASVALAQLLRLGHDAPVRQALFAESLTYAMLQTGPKYQDWLASRPIRAPVGDRDRVVDMERAGSLLNITLARPDRRNALNIAMRDQLFEALELLELDTSIDGAVLRGAGANFSGGGDLDEFGLTPSPAVGHEVRMARSLGWQMHRVAGRMRVHLHGACVGAGIELPAFAGSIIAHPDATFRLPEIGFGLVPGAGGTVSITRRCGRHRTAWLALTGRTIDASLALRWRLVDRIDPDAFPATTGDASPDRFPQRP